MNLKHWKQKNKKIETFKAMGMLSIANAITEGVFILAVRHDYAILYFHSFTGMSGREVEIFRWIWSNIGNWVLEVLSQTPCLERKKGTKWSISQFLRKVRDLIIAQWEKGGSIWGRRQDFQWSRTLNLIFCLLPPILFHETQPPRIV